MNVLILTPDRVGSTLLQRLITVYMVAHEYNKPVINLHELTNGIMKYYSPTFNREVLGKPNDGRPQGYYQSLAEITDLLESVDHYKTSRLAHYHIKGRQDTIAEQTPFYNYLNDNFYIISARRKNLLEHGLSWCIKTNSKKLNVYSHQEKINVFADIYKNKITVHPETLVKYLDQYIEYTNWVDNHFDVSSYFNYDDDLPRIEEYILNLDIFNNQPKKSWQDIFNLEFKDWNRCHYLISDLSGISNQLTSNRLQLTYDKTSIENEFNLQCVDKKDIPSSLSIADRQFLDTNGSSYVKAFKAIQELVDNKVLVTSIPIKLQTLLEKKLLIKNFNECVQVYNEWATKNNIGELYHEDTLNAQIANEIKNWHALPALK